MSAWFPVQLLGAVTVFTLFLWAIVVTYWLVAIYDVVRRVRDFYRCHFRGAC